MTERADINRMSFKELRRLVAEADLSGVPDSATFSVTHLNRGSLLLQWEEPPGSGQMIGMDLRRKCACGHSDCPDRDA